MKKSAKINFKPVILIAITILIMPVAFAGFLDVWNSITGRATTGTADVSITIGNTAPEINMVQSISAQSVTEASTSAVTFWFVATDADGVANLDDSTAQGRFQRTGEATRSNTSCSWTADINSTSANYTCTIDIWYWDGAGAWTINATIQDINNAGAENSSTTFTLQETTAMVMSPTNLTWTSISTSSTDTLSNNDPITINNTANKNITGGNVRVKGIDLQEIGRAHV